MNTAWLERALWRLSDALQDASLDASGAAGRLELRRYQRQYPGKSGRELQAQIWHDQCMAWLADMQKEDGA